MHTLTAIVFTLCGMVLIVGSAHILVSCILWLDNFFWNDNDKPS